MPVSGAWRLTYNMVSRLYSGEENIAFLYSSGYVRSKWPLEWKTEHYTYSSSGDVLSTSGRVITMEARAGDTITLRTSRLDGYYTDINFCAEYIPKNVE